MPPPTYREIALKRIDGLNNSFLRMYLANYNGDQRRFQEQSRQYVHDIDENLEKVAGTTTKRPVITWMRFKGEHDHGNFREACEVLERYVTEFKRVPEVATALTK